MRELRCDTSAPRLRRTGSRRDWRRTAEELDETPQVLRGCSEQHLVLYSAQAAQPKSIELQDALHVREPHFYFLAFAVRSLECLRVGKSANVVSPLRGSLLAVEANVAAQPAMAACSRVS
jgi:hypothetical protein